MGRNTLKGYKCIADYYDGLVSGESPETMYRKETEEYKERALQREKTHQEMVRHYELYGD